MTIGLRRLNIHDVVESLTPVFPKPVKPLTNMTNTLLAFLQDLERSPLGLGDLATRRIMWQLVRATAYLHARDVCLLL